MRGSIRRLTMVCVATAAFAVPAAPASAGLLDPVHHILTVPITVGPAPGTGTFVTLDVTSVLLQPLNFQSVTGFVGPNPFAGVLVKHVYLAPSDQGHYSLYGFVGGTVPVVADVFLGLDRYGKLYIINIYGTIGSQTFARTITFVRPI